MVVLISLISFLICLCAGTSVIFYLFGMAKEPGLEPTTIFLLYFLWPCLPLLLAFVFLMCLLSKFLNLAKCPTARMSHRIIDILLK